MGFYNDFLRKLFTQTAVVILRKKPSVLFCFASKEEIALWNLLGKRLCAELGLIYMLFSNTPHRICLFIYREDEMKKYLANLDTALFLQSYGYTQTENVNEMLAILKRRFSIHDFPHEIGVFLGYPLRDVKSFIEKHGKDYIYCGYWKVYHNLDECLKKFSEIDMARRQIIQTYNSGRLISKIS